MFRGQFLLELAIWGFRNMVFVQRWSLFGGCLSSRIDCTLKLMQTRHLADDNIIDGLRVNTPSSVQLTSVVGALIERVSDGTIGCLGVGVKQIRIR